jgi:hypothetical protein
MLEDRSEVVIGAMLIVMQYRLLTLMMTFELKCCAILFHVSVSALIETANLALRVT